MRILILILLVNTLVYGQEHARILSSTTTYDLDENQNVEITEHSVIKILSEKGYKFSVYQEYFDQFKKISDVTLIVYDKNNKKIKKLKKSDGREFGFNSSNEISDAKILIIDPDYKQYPFTLEVHSKIKLNGFTSLPTWVPRSTFHVGVDQSELTIIRPEDVVVNLKEEKITGEITKNGNRVITKYRIKDLPHINGKIRFIDFYNEQPKVLISPLVFKLDSQTGSNASWMDFGNWFLQLNDNPYKLDEKTIRFIDGVDKTDTKILIRNLYEYMQDKTRYVSIQLGIGGFKSIPTEEVEKYGFGDCKALTTYMKNLLDYAGIKSNYILVRAGKEVPDIVADFPSNQFNHVFLGIPLKSDTVLLECTSQILPDNYIGSFTDDRNVLWIDTNNSKLIQSHRYTYKDNVQENKSFIRVDNEGNAIIEINSTNHGVFFDEVMIFKSAPKDYQKHHNLEKFNFSDFELSEFDFSQSDRTKPIFNSRYVINVKGLAQKIDEKLILPSVPFFPVSSYLDRDNLMKFYSIKRGVTVLDEIQITIPSEYRINMVPETKEINSLFGKYILKTEFDGDILKVNRSIILYKGDYHTEGYQEFDEFYRKIESFERTRLILTNKT